MTGEPCPPGRRGAAPRAVALHPTSSRSQDVRRGAAAVTVKRPPNRRPPRKRVVLDELRDVTGEDPMAC
jgi:hypothetical protein